MRLPHIWKTSAMFTVIPSLSILSDRYFPMYMKMELALILSPGSMAPKIRLSEKDNVRVTCSEKRDLFCLPILSMSWFWMIWMRTIRPLSFYYFLSIISSYFTLKLSFTEWCQLIRLIYPICYIFFRVFPMRLLLTHRMSDSKTWNHDWNLGIGM